MNLETFKKHLSRSKRNQLFAGIFILLVGVLMLVAIFFSENKISYWIVVGFFFAIAIFITAISVKSLYLINSGKDPLLRAINEQDKGYLAWIYRNELTQQVGGINAAKSSIIIFYNRDGKQSQISIKRESIALGIIEYLSSEFPLAHLGYSKETREAVSKLLNKKL